MAKRAVVALTVVLGLIAVILLMLDGGYIRGAAEVTVLVGRTESHRPVSEKDVDTRIRPRTKEECQPQKQIVFVKTHKTASTTMATIIDYFAYRNNLSVVVPPKGQPYMDRTELFNRSMIAKLRKKALKWRDTVGFNVFSSHARFNRKEIEAVVPNAIYFTVLRDPINQLPSAFNYYKFDSRFQRQFDKRGRSYTNVFEEFMKDPAGNFELMSTHSMAHVLHNQQFFDLGLDPKYVTDWDRIDATIGQLDKELDLVLITEYLDESLILLRDLLCWTTEDILYTSKKVYPNGPASSRPVIRPEIKTRIRQWNGADTRLYDHYNRTLWEKIAAYGPRFDEELQKFRDLLENGTKNKIGHGKLVKMIAKRLKQEGIYA